MTQDDTRELWRLVADVSVEDAAILIAGGDPNENDWEDDSFGIPHAVKRTEGHPGFRAVFTSLTTAIRNRQLPAQLAYRIDRPNRHLHGYHEEFWLLSATEISHLRIALGSDPFGETQLEGAESIRVHVEPDWRRTTIDVDDLKTWLRARGYTQGFFFPTNEAPEEDADSIMDPLHDHFSPELALAVSVWRALALEMKENRSPKAAIDHWIDANPNAWHGGEPMSAKARERITTLVNWKKAGGAPPSSG